MIGSFANEKLQPKHLRIRWIRKKTSMFDFLSIDTPVRERERESFAGQLANPPSYRWEVASISDHHEVNRLTYNSLPALLDQ